jgi:hypothetical protein
VRDRLFSVDEANALIPRLEAIMAELQRHRLTLRDAVRTLMQETTHAAEDFTVAKLLELRPELRAVVEDMERLLGEIDTCGVQMKGLDLGLIDFPAEIDGENVLLCWQYGEKEVGHYHSVDAGFAGRRPLEGRMARPRYLQ